MLALVMPSCGSRSPDWLHLGCRPEVAADIATSLEALLTAQRQDIGECRELADTVDP